MRTRQQRDLDERYDENEMQDNEQEWEDEEEGKLLPPRVPFSQVFGFGAGTFLAAGLVDMLAHLGPTGLVIGGIAAYVASRHGPELYEQLREMLPPAAPTEGASHRRAGRRSLLDRALGRLPDEEGEEEVEEEEATERDEVQDETALVEDMTPTLAAEEANPFAQQAGLRQDSPPVARLSLSQIVEHTTPNSYEVYIGRSLTRPGYPAVKISFFKRHLKLIGASQHGKSSMAAALLTAILHTHDRAHVLLVVLDHEDKTGRLFARAPQLATGWMNGQPVRLHARNEEQVLACLECLAALLAYRYTLSEEALEQQPLVLVYLEEFIDLKDAFKQRVEAAGREDKEQARRDYARLVSCIKQLARRGLKVRVQLLLCAQVDYRDDDLQEALVNITSGMSFCVRVSAAQAAGFYQTALLARNAREDQIGQAVVEMPDCKDLILAPQYDLAAALKALEQTRRTLVSPQAPARDLSARTSRQEPPARATGERVHLPLPSPTHPASAGWVPTADDGAARTQSAPPVSSCSPVALSSRSDAIPRPSRHQEKYAREIGVWQELEEKQMATMRDFAATMQINEAKAYKVLCEMERLGLIAWERRKKKAF